MAHFADDAPCTAYGCIAAKRLRAVGWLERGHEHLRGEVEMSLITRLAELLEDPWQPSAAGGFHRCPFCRLGGPVSVQIGGLSLRPGSANLIVPATAFVYVAPSLILHYVDAHGYLPPEEFVDAVMRCPPMRSMEYLKLLKTTAPEWFAELTQR